MVDTMGKLSELGIHQSTKRDSTPNFFKIHKTYLQYTVVWKRILFIVLLPIGKFFIYVDKRNLKKNMFV